MIAFLLRVGVILLLLYLALVWGLPRLRALLQPGGSSPSAADAESADCVWLALEARKALAEGISRGNGPRRDRQSWNGVADEVADRLREARGACGCASDPCRLASAALDEMETLLSELDAGARGEARGWVNPARRQERIDGLLDQARVATPD